MQLFVIQVRTTQEEDFSRRVARARPDLTLHVLKKRLMIRKAGKTSEQASPLFPGYVFIEWGDADFSATVRTELRRTTGFIRFLPATTTPAPMRPADVELIRRFISFGREIGLSLVTFDEHERIKVLQGPLAGLEGNIVKVDRRKRRAKVRLDLYDDVFLFDLGFELMEESGGDAPGEGS